MRLLITIVFIGVCCILAFAQPEALLYSLGAVSLGAVLETGILGKVSGKVANVVGGTWKGINYVRAYFVPSNPNTSAQQLQRSKMRACIAFARQLTGSLIQPYWDKFAVAMSGFNHFVSENIGYFTSPNYYVTTSMLTAKGTLLGVENLFVGFDGGTLSITYDDNTNGSTGLSTDVLFFVIAHRDGTVYYCDTTNGERGTPISSPPSIDSGLTASELVAWAFYVRGSGSELQVSDSSAVVPTEV